VTRVRVIWVRTVGVCEVGVVGVVSARCLVEIDPAWRDPVRDAADHVAAPAEALMFAVVVAAEQGAVVDASPPGEAEVGDVVGLAP